MGHSKIELRSDNAPEMVKLQNDVLAMRSKECSSWTTIISRGKVRDSQSMGGVEVVVIWWHSKLITLRLAVERDYGMRVGPTHPLWAWLVRHSSFVNARLRV